MQKCPDVCEIQICKVGKWENQKKKKEFLKKFFHLKFFSLEATAVSYRAKKQFVGRQTSTWMPLLPVRIRNGDNLFHGSCGGWCCWMQMRVFCPSTRYRLRQVSGDLNDGARGAGPLTWMFCAAVHRPSFCWFRRVSVVFSLCQVSGARSMWKAPLATSVLIGVSASSRHLRCEVALLQSQRQLSLFYIDFSLAVHFAFSQECVHKPGSTSRSPTLLRMQEPGDLRLSESGKPVHVACVQPKDLPGTKL